MPTNWKNWCRFCAKCDFTEEDKIYKIESFEDQLEIINSCFKISLQPFEGIRPLVCGECCGFLAKLGSFRDRCVNADKMFRELIQSNIQDSNLQEIRLKHQIDQEKIQFEAEIAEILKKEDVILVEKETKTVDLTSEDSHKRSKKEKKKEKKRKRKASSELDEKEAADPKNKLFVVSYNEEKSYIAVTYEGKDLQYDDFVKKACSQLDLHEISIYDHNDIKIDRDAFIYVFKNNPPQYIVIKSKGATRTYNPENLRVGATSKIQIHPATQVSSSATNKEYLMQSFTISSDQSTDSQELEIGDTVIVKQEECEKEPQHKFRRDRQYSSQNGESSTDSMTSKTRCTMPKKTRNHRLYKRESMEQAVEELRKGKGIRETARKFGVPKSTLQDKFYGKSPGSVGHPTILSLDQEEELVCWVLEMADKGHPITEDQLLDYVQMRCKRMKIKNPFKDGRPGRSWYDGFMQRHPILTKISDSSSCRQRRGRKIINGLKMCGTTDSSI